MSFGFSIGDIIAVGELAFRLYRDCYQIARGAPQEFTLLVGEISTLSNSLAILKDEVQNPASSLIQAGESRVRLATDLVHEIYMTLRGLESYAKKYQILGSSSKGRAMWLKFKWSAEFSSIDRLRNKMTYHNGLMSLLLTSVGNSSLERMTSSNKEIQDDIRDIKGYLYTHSRPQETTKPSISAIDDDLLGASLTSAFMKNAEMFQDWNTIGIYQWIEAGRWWLVRSQLDLHVILEKGQEVPLAAYISLIKASWILVDIVECHPERAFIAAVTFSEVRQLSLELRNEFGRISNLELVTPYIRSSNDQHLQIWETVAKGSFFRPRRNHQDSDEWTVDSGEQVLFHGLAQYNGPCILLFLVIKETLAARLVAQNQYSTVTTITTFPSRLEDSLQGSNLQLGEFQIRFKNEQDAHYVRCLIEGSNLYLQLKTVKDPSVKNLTAFVLFMAIKNHFYHTVMRLLQKALPAVEASEAASDERAPYSIHSDYRSIYLKCGSSEEILSSYGDNSHELSLISWALYYGFHSLARVLLDETPSFDGNARVFDLREPPLVLASISGNERLANSLISRGADIHGRGGRTDMHGNYLSFTPLYGASEGGHEKVVQLLLNHGAQDTDMQELLKCLHSAAKEGHMNIVKLLVDGSVDLNTVDVVKLISEKALICASTAGRETVLLTLLSAGANPLLTNKGQMDTTQEVLRTTCDDPGSFSDTTVHTLLSTACTFRVGRPLLYSPSHQLRRANVIYEVKGQLSYLWLDSHHAFIERPLDIPECITIAHDKIIRFEWPRKNQKKNKDLFKLKFSFSIIHREEALDFTVTRYQFWDGPLSREAGAKVSYARLKIVNGGERARETCIEGFRGGQNRNMIEKWRDVELDPNAEPVESAFEERFKSLHCTTLLERASRLESQV